MKVQLQQLRYFVAVAETRHFTQAAELTGVAQPSLSKQIHALEAELGAPLFTRARGNVDAHRRPARRCCRWPGASSPTWTPPGARCRSWSGCAAAGCGWAPPRACARAWSPRCCAASTTTYPGIRLQVEEGGSQDLVGELGRGAPRPGADRAARARHRPGPATAEPILRENLVVASAGRRRSPAGAGPVPLTDLRDQPLVMFRTATTCATRPWRPAAAPGSSPTFAVEGGEMDAVLGFVEAGLGVAVVPWMVLAGRPGLRATPLAPPGLHRTIALAHRRDVTPTHAARAVRGVLHAYLTEAMAWNTLPAGVQTI